MASKRYKVIGPHPIDGHPPGEEFVADYSEEEEQRRKEAGHIRVVEAAPYSKKKEE